MHFSNRPSLCPGIHKKYINVINLQVIFIYSFTLYYVGVAFIKFKHLLTFWYWTKKKKENFTIIKSVLGSIAQGKINLQYTDLILMCCFNTDLK